MSDLSHGKVNILPLTAAVLLCLCLLSFSRVGSVYGKLTDEEATPSEFMTDSDASRYYDYDRATASEVERIEVESAVIEIPEPDPMAGYEFLGWNTCGDGSGDWYFPGELFEMTEECTDFYAIWEKILKTTPSQAVKKASGSDAVPAGGGAAAAPAKKQPEETAQVPESVEAVTEEAAAVVEVTEVTETAEISEGESSVEEESEILETEEVTETETAAETLETEAAETPEK